MSLRDGYDWRPSRRLTVSCWREGWAGTCSLLRLDVTRIPLTGTCELAVAVLGLQLQLTVVMSVTTANAFHARVAADLRRCDQERWAREEPA